MVGGGGVRPGTGKIEAQRTSTGTSTEHALCAQIRQRLPIKGLFNPDTLETDDSLVSAK